MAKEYPVIAVIGTEECKKEMEQIQEKLTKQRHIVVPIGMCGKEDLDMRLDKIDLAEELFVVNPAGKIEMNIWTDICYAYLTGKDISSLESMSYREIQEKANDLIMARKCWLRDSWKWYSIIHIWIRMLFLFLISNIQYMTPGSERICRKNRLPGVCMKI